MQLLVRKYTRCICVPPLVDEIKTLVVYTKKKVDGGTAIKIAAAPGKHDDIVMSVAHAYNAMYYNAAMLKRRHGIEVDVKTWLINENRTAFSFSNRPASARVSITLKEVNGVLHEIFYDNKYKKEITEQEMQQILEERNDDKYVSDKDYKEPEEIEIKDEVKEELSKRFSSVTSDNIKIVSEDEYDMYKNGLQNSSDIYNDNLNGLMNDLLSGTSF